MISLFLKPGCLYGQPGASDTFIKTFVGVNGRKIENVDSLVMHYIIRDSSKCIYKSNNYYYQEGLGISLHNEQRIVFKQKNKYMIIDFKNVHFTGSPIGIPLSYIDTIQFMSGYFIVDFEKVMKNINYKTVESFKETGININSNTRELYRQKGWNKTKKKRLLRKCDERDKNN